MNPYAESTAPTWLPTTTGKRFEILAPTADMIDISDIATSLAKIPRWIGKTHLPYSVAQHSVWVSYRVTQLAAPFALLHDAHEAYVNDISSPLKAALRQVSRANGIERDLLDEIVEPIDAVIFRKFGLPWPVPPHIRIAVKYADMQALSTEKRDLCVPHPDWAQVPLPPEDAAPIKPLPWAKAHDQFMRRFAELFGHAFL